jgi:Tfp pilus assembly protein PilO
MSPQLRNIIVMIISVLLIFFGSYIFIIKNLSNKKFIIAENKSILEKQLAKKQAQIKHAILYKKQISKLNQIYRADNKKLITLSLTLLLDQLAKIAQSSKVGLQSVQPFPTKQQKQMVVYPVQFAVVGTYSQISQFVTTLVDSFSFVVLQNFKLTKVKNNKLNMQTTCIVYGKQEIKENG